MQLSVCELLFKSTKSNKNQLIESTNQWITKSGRNFKYVIQSEKAKEENMNCLESILNTYITADNMSGFSWEQVTWQLNQLKSQSY